MGQLGNGMHRRQLHLFVDRRRADVQRAAEDEREAEHIVDLVRIVGAAGADDGIIADLLRQRRQNFRLRIGQGEDQRRARHLLHHLRGQHFRTGAAEENVRAVDHVIEGAFAVVFHCIGRFGFRHVGLTILIDNAFRIADHDVVLLHPQRHQQVHAGNCRRPGAGDHHPHVGQILLNDAQAVEDRRGADDRRAVLIVVENRNIHPLAQLLLNVETLRRFNIFEVDTAEGRLEGGDDVNEFIRVQLIDFDIKHIDAGEFLKQDAFALHHRLAGQRADVTESQHRGAVGDHRHQVAAGGIFVGRQRIFFNFQTGGRDARRVGQRQIALGGERFGRRDLDFSGNRKFVEVEGALF
ncbi:hypothetical protein SB00610_01831 [Klebsiella quasipneumoniae subsp. similipneumoniae]|nr:hypothetical protein SB00610_01831 [Klebsiella quasipneumoniae subsp. similipneumoniae]